MFSDMDASSPADHPDKVQDFNYIVDYIFWKRIFSLFIKCLNHGWLPLEDEHVRREVHTTKTYDQIEEENAALEQKRDIEI